MSYVGWEDTIASGWGLTSVDDYYYYYDSPNTLQYVKVPPVADEVCSAGIDTFIDEYYGSPSPSPAPAPAPSSSGPTLNSMICAGKIKTIL